LNGFETNKKTSWGIQFLSLTNSEDFKFKGKEALHTSGQDNNHPLVTSGLEIISILIRFAKDIFISHPPTHPPGYITLLLSRGIDKDSTLIWGLLRLGKRLRYDSWTASSLASHLAMYPEAGWPLVLQAASAFGIRCKPQYEYM
jgi:hypothetical protein